MGAAHRASLTAAAPDALRMGPEPHEVLRAPADLFLYPICRELLGAAPEALRPDPSLQPLQKGIIAEAARAAHGKNPLRPTAACATFRNREEGGAASNIQKSAQG